MSFLRWAGSKRQVIPVLRKYWLPHYDRYVEPFAGSCSLFFAIRPEKALLADKNPSNRLRPRRDRLSPVLPRSLSRSRSAQRLGSCVNRGINGLCRVDRGGNDSRLGPQLGTLF
ncbi:MAG: hypothetical protein GY716_13370 [bacterium]|nr:hypothetical protein [bacterium]